LSVIAADWRAGRARGWGEKDLPPGEKLVACLRPFLEHLVGSDLTPKTIQKHNDNLWMLGGEIIRNLNEDPSQRKLPVDRLCIMRSMLMAARDSLQVP